MRRTRLVLALLALAAVVGASQALLSHGCAAAGDARPPRLTYPEPAERLDPVTNERPDPTKGDVVVPRKHLFLGPEKPWSDEGR